MTSGLSGTLRANSMKIYTTKEIRIKKTPTKPKQPKDN